jgi:hypothetical protein
VDAWIYAAHNREIRAGVVGYLERRTILRRFIRITFVNMKLAHFFETTATRRLPFLSKTFSAQIATDMYAYVRSVRK